jgi:hypothetical protein
MVVRHARFENVGIDITIPDGWTDASIIALTRGRTSVVVTSERIRDADTLHTHAMRRVAELGTQLVGFDLAYVRDDVVGGLPAILARFTWIDDRGPIEQSMAFVERTGSGERAVTVVTSTLPAARPPVETTAMRAALDAVVAGIVFEDSPRETAPPAPPPRVASRFYSPPEIPMPGVASGRRSA